MKGRRLPNTPLGDLPEDLLPGDYWLCTNDDYEPIEVTDEPSNLTGHMAQFVAPKGGVGTLRKHTIRIEDDDTFSIRHNDGSSNSIHFAPGTSRDWHGFMERGEWQEL